MAKLQIKSEKAKLFGDFFSTRTVGITQHALKGQKPI